MPRAIRLICLLLIIAYLAALSRAAVSPNHLFCDHMVLQRDVKVPVWGTAAPGEKVSVSIGEQKLTTTADAQGKWLVKLTPMKAGGPFEMTIAGEDTTVLKDVMVGEVWVASGQSNMEYGLGHAINGKQEILDANYPDIRVFTVKTVVAGEPLTDVSGQWDLCTPVNAARFTATGYFFVRELYKDLKIPIGLIHSSVSGTLAEAWTRPEVMRGVPELDPILARYDEAIAKYPAEMDNYKKALTDWEAAKQQAAADNKPAPPKPREPADPAKLTTRPGGLYNGKIAPLIPYAMRGVIWWQGEYNSERCEQYKILFPALIRDWRKQWGQGDFPFFFMQLQNLDIQPQPNAAHYDEMREAQLFTWKTVLNTGMAVMCDVGDAHDIHPPNKQEAGRRLALIARATVYKEKDLPYSGPIYKSMKVEGDKIRLTFNYLNGGLELKNPEAVGSFQIAGADKKFVPAEVKIDGDTLVVWSKDVTAPLSVRYAWADNPACTLYNKAGLPASPFRTDDWPLLTMGKF